MKKNKIRLMQIAHGLAIGALINSYCECMYKGIFKLVVSSGVAKETMLNIPISMYYTTSDW